MTTLDSRPTATQVRRGLSWSTTSNLAIRIGNFAVSILMARLIAPEQFGVFAVALTVWSILGTLAEFGLGSDLVRSADFERRAPTVGTIGLVTSGALALSMALAAPLIAQAFDSPASTPIIQLMSVSLLVFGFSIVPAARLQRDFRQGTLFAVNGSALVISAGVLTALALSGYGPVALAAGQITTQVVTVIGLFLATRRRFRLGFDRAIAAESATFCLPLAGANLLSWLLLSIDNLIVARALSPVELGFYVLAFNVSTWPMNAIGQAVRVVALPALAKLTSDAERARVLTTVIGPLWCAGLLLGTMLATLAGPVMTLLYGERWSPAAAALVGLGVFGAIRVVFDLLATYLVAAGATRPVLLVQVIWLVTMVPAMWFAVRQFGIAGAGWAHVAVAGVVVLPAYLVFLARIGVAWRRLLRACLPATLAILPTAAVSAWIAGAVANPLLAILAGGAAAAVLYIAPLTPWCRRRLQSLRTISDPSSRPEKE